MIYGTYHIICLHMYVCTNLFRLSYVCMYAYIKSLYDMSHTYIGTYSVESRRSLTQPNQASPHNLIAAAILIDGARSFTSVTILTLYSFQRCCWVHALAPYLILLQGRNSNNGGLQSSFHVAGMRCWLRSFRSCCV